MKRLYLMRHAKSDWGAAGLDDFDRPLNDRGRESARVMGTHMESAGHHPSVVFCSSALRTRQTLDIVLGQMSEEPPVHIEDNLYLAAARKYLGIIHRLKDRYRSALFIGHNPGIETLALDLAAPPNGREQAKQAARLTHKFPTGALAVLEADIAHWNEIREGCCLLRGFVRPKHVASDTSP